MSRILGSPQNPGTSVHQKPGVRSSKLSHHGHIPAGELASREVALQLRWSFEVSHIHHLISSSERPDEVGFTPFYIRGNSLRLTLTVLGVTLN